MKVKIVLAFCALLLTASDTKLSIEKASSIHFNERPEEVVIDTIVLHASERTSIEELKIIFNHELYPVSSHYAIDKAGKVFQFVPDKLRAWHAGDSKLPGGKENVNDFSIGVELINKNDGNDPYTTLQLQSLGRLIAKLKANHPIDKLVTHASVALPLGRKSDPKNFPFEKLDDIKDLKVLK